MDSLVSTDRLAAEMGDEDLVVADATLFLPDSGRDARAEYLDAHIPGAVFLDLATLNDGDDPRPNMVPRPAAFAVRMQALGIADDSRVVLYDNSPLRSAARAWWLLRHFGASRVAILDGGLAKWRAEGRPVASGPEATREAQFTPAPAAGTIADKAEVRGNIDRRASQLVDARAAERFAGGPPDAHGVAGGHVPGAANLPFATLYGPDGTMRPEAELRAAFAGAGVDLGAPLIASCGSGVTACSLLFAAHRLGKDDARLYDGSWSEWGADPDTPKATGAA